MAEREQQPKGKQGQVWRGWTSTDYIHCGLWAVHLECGHVENAALGVQGWIPESRLFRCSACEAGEAAKVERATVEAMEPVYRAAARRLYGSDQIEIDDVAAVSVTEEGSAWVQAWVHVEADALQLGASPGALPACGACGERAGWVISAAAPVYVTVDPSGAVSKVRVNDEGLELEFEGAWNRDWGFEGRRSMVTCAACDAQAPEEIGRRVRAAALAEDSWPSWELGA